MSDLLASKLREEVFTAIRAHTAATVSETEAATLAILRLVENAAPSDDETCTGCYGTGYDGNREGRCHCQPALDAALGRVLRAAAERDGPEREAMLRDLRQGRVA